MSVTASGANFNPSQILNFSERLDNVGNPFGIRDDEPGRYIELSNTKLYTTSFLLYKQAINVNDYAAPEEDDLKHYDDGEMGAYTLKGTVKSLQKLDVDDPLFDEFLNKARVNLGITFDISKMFGTEPLIYETITNEPAKDTGSLKISPATSDQSYLKISTSKQREYIYIRQHHEKNGKVTESVQAIDVKNHLVFKI
jgi:hypothetical protein